MIVEWRALAWEDRRNLFDSIAADNPIAASELDDRIGQLAEVLRTHPELYPAGRVGGELAKWFRRPTMY
ncbi:type II toxin-antitoxin system RelE/ParE family toxin [Burkholderia savannae]|uniref:type II toxin-antitoxin system RelE/ParE family toxin n=1 Tax=Burkholderia savannae TaxID=1637837 RepID=UPI000A476ABB